MATPAQPEPPVTQSAVRPVAASTPRTFRADSPSLAAPDALPAEAQGSSARFLISVAIVLAAAVAAAYFANGWITTWALEHHLHTAQLNLSAAMGGLFAGGLAALITILIVTNIGKSSRS